MAEIKVTKKVQTPSHTVEHIHISKLGNGYHVRHHVKSNETKRIPGGGHMPMPTTDPEPMAFTGPKAKKMMLAHVGDLSDQMGLSVGAGTGDGGGQGGNLPGAAQPAPTTSS
jgi:hypothetical protein